uniref:Gluconokinase n=1 Tax=Strongyloides stercoralis TaxID=6248 RepID=A0A0K0EHC9_STRER
MSNLIEPTTKNKNNYILIVMGVSGSGKSTIGEYLSHQLNIEFIEGDFYHSINNIEKMKLGNPLNDEDRLPWLTSINEKLRYEFFKNHKSVVLSCSALKRKYRDILKFGFSVNDIILIYLDVDENEIKKRLKNRKEHFFNPVLVKSQFEILEEPTEDEGKEVIRFSAIKTILELKRKIINIF